MLNFIEDLQTKEMKNSIYIKIIDILKELRDSYANTYYRIMNPGEEPLNEDERLMLTNPADRQNYLKALENLKKAREEGKIQATEEVKLSNGQVITITTVS